MCCDAIIRLVQVFFLAVDKAWKTKVSSVVSRHGPQTGLLSCSVGFPLLEVNKIKLTAHHW